MNIIALIIVFFYFIETKDLSKGELYSIMRGLVIGMGEGGKKEKIFIPKEEVGSGSRAMEYSKVKVDRKPKRKFTAEESGLVNRMAFG